MIKSKLEKKSICTIFGVFFAAILVLLFVDVAHAWLGYGNVYCDVNQDGEIDSGDIPLESVEVNLVNIADTWSGSDVTDADGRFDISLPDYPESFIETLNNATLPDDADIIPLGGHRCTPVPELDEAHFFTTDTGWNRYCDWLIDSAICRPTQEEQCWLTAGGVKFSNITGGYVDEFKLPGSPMHNWGGNVNPACAPIKGHWNHMAHKDALHFQATDIEVIRCGNVPDIDPGSESPVTPFNFIEFTGPATLTGIKGNKDVYGADGAVCYFARAEDRNEPGSYGAKDGNDIDRYFLHVYDCDTDETLLLVDVDGDPLTIDPVNITGGNMQMHWKPCDN